MPARIISLVLRLHRAHEALEGRAIHRPAAIARHAAAHVGAGAAVTLLHGRLLHRGRRHHHRRRRELRQARDGEAHLAEGQLAATGVEDRDPRHEAAVAEVVLGQRGVAEEVGEGVLPDEGIRRHGPLLGGDPLAPVTLEAAEARAQVEALAAQVAQGQLGHDHLHRRLALEVRVHLHLQRVHLRQLEAVVVVVVVAAIAAVVAAIVAVVLAVREHRRARFIEQVGGAVNALHHGVGAAAPGGRRAEVGHLELEPADVARAAVFLQVVDLVAESIELLVDGLLALGLLRRACLEASSSASTAFFRGFLYCWAEASEARVRVASARIRIGWRMGLLRGYRSDDPWDDGHGWGFTARQLRRPSEFRGLLSVWEDQLEEQREQRHPARSR